MTPGSSVPEFEIRSADWLGVREAIDRILAAAAPLDEEAVPLREARERALAEAIIARATLPPWNNSAMDGFAVFADDISGAGPSTPVVLPVVGSARAGDPLGDGLEAGTAIRIMTGAPVPPGADSVVRVEDTDAEAVPGRVRIFLGRDARRHVRPAGEDMRLGDTLLERGHSIGAAAVGLLAAAGRDRVLVHRRPVVAVLTTGNELRGPDRYDEVRSGAGVPESNGPMLTAAIEAAGGLVRYLGTADDHTSAIRERIEASVGAEVLVTVGGASMGDADLVKRVLDELGFELDFWRVRMRPGSPFSFGWLGTGADRRAVFGLPGNPTSAFVTFELFVRPFLLALGGHARVGRRTLVCRAAEDLTGASGLTSFLRVAVEDGGHAASRDGLPLARLGGPQGSGLVRTMALAVGLAVVPEGVECIPAGSDVEVMLIDDGPGFAARPGVSSSPGP